MHKKRTTVKPIRFTKAEIGTAAELIRLAFQALGPDRSRKFNWWISQDDHAELTLRAYSHAQEVGLEKPSLSAYLAFALGLPSHHARISRAKARARRRLRVVK